MALYEIRNRLLFPKKSDADEVWAKLKGYLKNKDIRNLVDEPSFIEYIICRHDEGKSCSQVERIEK